MERSGPALTWTTERVGTATVLFVCGWVRQAVVLVARPRARRERQGDWLWGSAFGALVAALGFCDLTGLSEL